MSSINHFGGFQRQALGGASQINAFELVFLAIMVSHRFICPPTYFHCRDGHCNIWSL